MEQRLGLKLIQVFFFFFFFFFFLLISCSMVMGLGHHGDHDEVEEQEEMFLLQSSKQVVKTEAGEVRVVKGGGWSTKGKQREGGRGGGGIDQIPMHIGFINMEPKSLFLPQYMDSSLIMFIRRGEAKIGWIYKDGLVEKQLKMGDVYRIPAGSAFYLVNTGKGQRLQIICSIDTSQSLGRGLFQSFFIGGGSNPSSVLAGFDRKTLSTAFNVSSSELDEIMTSQSGGPIIYVESTGHESNKWAKFMQLKHQEIQQQLYNEDDEENEVEQSTWSWRKLFMFFQQEENKTKKTKRVGSPDAYNLYDRKPDFKNNYGWSLALDENDYAPLSHSGIGVYLVNLTAGSMMAPHVNPTATEYGIVLKGAGSIQVVHPNGTLAMNTKVEEGDVFWVPRYFPFCQIASRSGPMEFFGFTTSARKNRPQFLVGASSILQTMRGPELAMAFDVSEERLRNLINAQRESVILPSAPVSAATTKSNPDEHKEEMKMGRTGTLIREIGNEMIMDFD